MTIRLRGLVPHKHSSQSPLLRIKEKFQNDATSAPAPETNTKTTHVNMPITIKPNINPIHSQRSYKDDVAMDKTHKESAKPVSYSTTSQLLLTNRFDCLGSAAAT
ncbi:unnamed protein product [Cochlearia groenlandica]